MLIQCATPRCPGTAVSHEHPFCAECWERLTQEEQNAIAVGRRISRQDELQAIQAAAQRLRAEVVR